MELIKIAELIESKIKTLERGRHELEPRAKAKAEAIANYEKALAKKLIQLKNGITFQLDGETIENPPATLSEKIARGLCYDEKIKSELAEAQYKNAVIGLQTIQAELNGLQSINRYLSEK